MRAFSRSAGSSLRSFLGLADLAVVSDAAGSPVGSVPGVTGNSGRVPGIAGPATAAGVAAGLPVGGFGETGKFGVFGRPGRAGAFPVTLKGRGKSAGDGGADSATMPRPGTARASG